MEKKQLSIVGMIDRIGETIQVTDNFSKRELVIIEDFGGQYPNPVKFEFTQKNTSKLDYVNPGDMVEVSFNVRGREFNNKKTGEMDVFQSLQGWYVKKVDVKQSAPEPAADTNDLPF